MQSVEKVESAAYSDDPDALGAACSGFIHQLARQASPIGPAMAHRVLEALRSSRRFRHILEVAQAIINDGCEDTQILCPYAQALIECGQITPAIAMLDGVIANPRTAAKEADDARGILGRAWKEKAIAARGKRDAAAAEALRNAYQCYKSVYDRNPAAFYQGINRVALAAWDRGLVLSEDERAAALQSANDILKSVSDMPEEQRTARALATAGEALIALGRLDEAFAWFKEYVRHDDTDSFALGGTVRQLTDIWKLDDQGDGRALLAPLRARLLELPGGSFTVKWKDVRRMASVEEADFERVLGDVGPRTHSWMQQGFDTARSIALVRAQGRGIGTGFLVRGGDLDKRLGEERLVLTNAHVVSDPPQEGALRPEEARVSFELAPAIADPKANYEVSIIWQSPPSRHDACLLRLNPPPPEILKPLRLSSTLPALGDDSRERVYIIGHPGGGEISFSFEDNELLDYERSLLSADEDPSPCRVHYRTPTQRGSSGSPVFNGDWLTIALHHAGSREMRRLNGREGRYGANEGIWIQSIRRAMAKAELAQHSSSK
jgi:tetratricopeptide (TPR) repeat protein